MIEQNGKTDATEPTEKEAEVVKKEPEPDNTATASPEPIPPVTPEPDQPPEPSTEQDDALKSLEQLVSKSVLETLNKMKIGELITNATNDAVKAQFDQIIAQAKTLPIPGDAGGGQGGGGQGGGGDNLMQQAIMAFLTKQMAGNGGGGGNQLADAIKSLVALQEASASLYVNPQLQALQMFSTIFRTGASVGKSPEELAKAADALANNIRETARVKPPQ